MNLRVRRQHCSVLEFIKSVLCYLLCGKKNKIQVTPAWQKALVIRIKKAFIIGSIRSVNMFTGNKSLIIFINLKFRLARFTPRTPFLFWERRIKPVPVLSQRNVMCRVCENLQISSPGDLWTHLWVLTLNPGIVIQAAAAQMCFSYLLRKDGHTHAVVG